MDSTALNKELSMNVITPLYLFLAEDDYIARSYYALLKKKAVDNAFTELNISEYDARKSNPTDVIASCMTLPIMAEHRVVSVRDASFAKCSELCETLVRYSKKTCETTVLVVYANGIDKRTSLYKSFSQNGKIVEFAKLKQADLVKWIRSSLKKKNLEIAENALRFFIDSSDYLSKDSEIDLGYFANEIDKLALSAPKGTELTQAMLKQTLSVNISEDIFRFSDDLLSGNLADAYLQIEKLLYHNAAFQQISAVVAKAIRTFCICRSLNEQGKSEASIAKEYGLHPYVVKKSIAAGANFSLSEGKKALLVINQLDVAVKVGEIEPNVALALLAQEIGGRTFHFAERTAV